MNNVLLLILIPLLLITLAPILQIFLSHLRLKGKITMPIMASAVLAFIHGIILSFVATAVSTMGLSPDIKCATGCVVFIGLGLLITIITTPLLGIIYYILYRRKQRMTLS
jgi:hypothetical protein